MKPAALPGEFRSPGNYSGKPILSGPAGSSRRPIRPETVQQGPSRPLWYVKAAVKAGGPETAIPGPSKTYDSPGLDNKSDYPIGQAPTFLADPRQLRARRPEQRRWVSGGLCFLSGLITLIIIFTIRPETGYNHARTARGGHR